MTVLDQIQANELEGLVEADIEDRLNIAQYQLLRAEIAKLEAKKKDLGATLMKSVTEKGGVALLVGGLPIFRKQVVHKRQLDTKRLKEEKPEVYAEYSEEKVTIQPWVRATDS